MDENALKHAPPMPDRGSEATLYLPVSGDGNVDSPEGSDSGSSVYVWDKAIDGLNSKSLNRDPDHTWSYDTDECGQGCTGIPPATGAFDAEQVFDAPMRRIVEAMEHVAGSLKSYEGEQWVDRINQVYGPHSAFDLATIAATTDDVYNALTAAVEATDTAADNHLEALHDLIHQGRDNLSERWDATHLDAWNALDLLGWSNPYTAVVSAGFLAYDVFDWYSKKHSTLDPSNAKKLMVEGQQAAEQAVSEFEDTLRTWTATANESNVHITDPSDKGNRAGADPQQAVQASVTKPADTPDTKPSDLDENGLKDALDRLLDSGTPSMPSMHSMPSMPDMGGGGMPGGGMPSMPDMGGGAPGGMPEMPMGGAQDEPFADDEPLDDDKDVEEDSATDATEDDAAVDDDAEVGGSDNPSDQDIPEDGEPPVDGTDAPPAEPDPNSEAARTVSLPDGKQVTFPSKAMADAVKHMLDADPANPKSFYMAASEAGYHLPPMGQDIGEGVSPRDMRAGDVVVADGKTGVFLGHGDVLMEDQSVQKLTDVANFDGASQGVFRLEEPSTGGPGLGGVEQPLGSGANMGDAGAGTVSTPGQVTEQAGTPGVPTDDTSVAADMGTSSNTQGIDPSTAFPA